MAYLQFVGMPNEYLVGVPNRDLSAADQAALAVEPAAVLTQHLAQNPSPIYVSTVGEPPPPDPPSPYVEGDALLRPEL